MTKPCKHSQTNKSFTIKTKNTRQHNNNAFTVLTIQIRHKSSLICYVHWAQIKSRGIRAPLLSSTVTDWENNYSWTIDMQSSLKYIFVRLIFLCKWHSHKETNHLQQIQHILASTKRVKTGIDQEIKWNHSQIELLAVWSAPLPDSMLIVWDDNKYKVLTANMQSIDVIFLYWFA